MPYLETAQSWLTQSTLLIQARPTTTRITTKYTIKPPVDPAQPPRKARRNKQSATADSTPHEDTSNLAPASEAVRAILTLKTYDPVSGTTLKYNTTKQAEVSRLVQILGRLARPMAGLPESKEEVATSSLPAGDVGSGLATQVESTLPSGKGAAGKKGKKKGKK